MDKSGRSSSASVNVREEESAAGVANSVERDFSNLLGIFDRQLSVLPEGDSGAREHILAARAAAVAVWERYR